MKLKQIILKNGDVVGSTKESVIATALAYNKTYELLHKQLYRKNRIYYANSTFSFNGRTVRPILKWDIKSPSRNPYDRDSIYNLGLNQFFMGQSPYAQYIGDLEDGIYHDTCYIYSKAQEVSWITSHDIFGWHLAKWDSDDGGSWMSFEEKIYEFDKAGNRLYDNVIIEEEFEEREITTTETIVENGIETQVETTTTETISLGFFYKTYLNQNLINRVSVEAGTSIVYVNFSETERYPRYMIIDWPNCPYGSFIQSETLSYELNYNSLNSVISDNRGANSLAIGELITGETPPKLYIFPDGTTIAIIPPINTTVTFDLGDMHEHQDVNIDAQIVHIPLLYADTGDLVQNKFDFIDNWESQFDLLVHEDGSWYQGLINVVIFVVSVVVGFLAGGPAGAIVGAIGAIGTIKGDKALQIIGAIGSIATAGYQALTTNLIKEFVAQGMTQAAATAIAKDMILNMAVGEMFKVYASTAGLSNILSLGSSLYSTYQIATTEELTKTTSEAATEAESKMIGMTEEEQQPFNDYINSVITLPLKL